MPGNGDRLMRVERKVLGGDTKGDSAVLVEVKEELEDAEGCIGEAMTNFLHGRGGVTVGSSGYGGLVPGVEALPGGRVPELLGFSEHEIAQVLPSRSLGSFVPYLGDVGVAAGRGRGELHSQGGSRGVRLRAVGRGGLRRPSLSLSERRRRRRRPVFGSGRPIRLLGNINRALENRPLQMRSNYVCPVAAVNRRKGGISLFSEGHYYRPVSWHRQQYDASSEGFGKTGRYHPEDARLKTSGTFDAICEDLQLYKVPPVYWPEPLSFTDFYRSSSSSENSENSGSSGRFGLFVLAVMCKAQGVQEVRLGDGKCRRR